MLDQLRNLAKMVVRKRTQVVFGDMARVQPVSRIYGWERGTPIDRYYIEQFLQAHQDCIQGFSAEVAEARYITQFGANVTARAVLAPAEGIGKKSPGTEVFVVDLTKTDTVPEEKFDTFVCTQTYNFIYEARAAIANSRRLLKPGGRLVGTVAGFCQVSRYDADRWGDYWRFSEAATRRMLEEVFEGGVVIQSYGNALASQAFLQGLAVEDLPRADLLDVADPDYPVIIGFVATR